MDRWIHGALSFMKATLEGIYKVLSIIVNLILNQLRRHFVIQINYLCIIHKI